jgi:hypothetical protein
VKRTIDTASTAYAVGIGGAERAAIEIGANPRFMNGKHPGLRTHHVVHVSARLDMEWFILAMSSTLDYLVTA